MTSVALILGIDHRPRSVMYAQNCATKTALAGCTGLDGRPDLTFIGLPDYCNLSRPSHQTQRQHTKMGRVKLLSLASNGSDDPDPCPSRRSLALDVFAGMCHGSHNNHSFWQVSFEPFNLHNILHGIYHSRAFISFFLNPLLQNHSFWFASFCSL